MKKTNRLLLFVVLTIILSSFSSCSLKSGPCQHIEVTIDPGIAPTCTTGGKTYGKHCSACGEVLIEQKNIAALGHKWGEWQVTERATTERQGSRTHTCNVCNYVENKSIDIISYDGKLGSAGKLSDTTLIISIFANDKETKWEPNSETDNKTKDLMHENLSAAVTWINEQCSVYGVESEFVYDWKNCPDLCYTFSFTDSMVKADGGGYFTQSFYIDSYIDAEELKQRYNAQNIIYILYFNTDETNTFRSWTLSHLQKCSTELINMYVRLDNGSSRDFMSPSCFAHEILHCFGAHDLYYASETITQQFVDHCNTIKSNDIMYTVSTEKEISQELSELDAYYVGLIDSCSQVDEFGLGASSHITEPK